MAILSFLRRRRTLSKWADDKAVQNFTRAAEQAGLTPKRSAFDAAMEDDAREREAYLHQLEKLTGVRPPEP